MDSRNTDSRTEIQGFWIKKLRGLAQKPETRRHIWELRVHGVMRHLSPPLYGGIIFHLCFKEISGLKSALSKSVANGKRRKMTYYKKR